MAATPDDDAVPPRVRDRLTPTGDPTQTVTRRREFRRSGNARWRRVRGDLRATLQTKDALDLTGRRATPARTLAELAGTGGDQSLRPRSLPHGNDAQREAAIAEWFRRVLRQRVLPVDGPHEARRGEGWWHAHLRDAYVRGLGLATADARRTGVIDADPGEDARHNPTQAFQSDRHQQALAAQSVQTYNDLEGIVDAAHTEVVRETGDALAAGAGVTALAERVRDRVNAVGQTRTAVMAETRVVETVNRAIVEQADAMGASQLGAIPETDPDSDTGDGGDDRRAAYATAENPCPQCAPLAGTTTTVGEIKSGDVPVRIPQHPQCRCRWVVVG